MHSTNLSTGNRNKSSNYKSNSHFKNNNNNNNAKTTNGNTNNSDSYSNLDLNAVLNSKKSSYNNSHKSAILGAQLISSQLKGMSSSMIDQIAKGKTSNLCSLFLFYCCIF